MIFSRGFVKSNEYDAVQTQAVDGVLFSLSILFSNYTHSVELHCNIHV
jgi:hypothetical protein